MPFLRACRRWFALACLGLAICLCAARAAHAAAPMTPVVQEKSYVKSYALVVLGIALGVLVVCRSANRTTEIKYDDDE